jgi:hypothetical protein
VAGRARCATRRKTGRSPTSITRSIPTRPATDRRSISESCWSRSSRSTA